MSCLASMSNPTRGRFQSFVAELKLALPLLLTLQTFDAEPEAADRSHQLLRFTRAVVQTILLLPLPDQAHVLPRALQKLDLALAKLARHGEAVRVLLAVQPAVKLGVGLHVLLYLLNVRYG